MTLSLIIEQVTMKYLFGQASMPFLTFFVAMGAWMSALNPAAAQPWPRLPDGSVVLTIQGDRVVIPAEMTQLPDHMSFRNVPTISERSSTVRLRDILADPDRFRPLLDNRTGGISLSARVGSVADTIERSGHTIEEVRSSPWLAPFGIGSLAPSLSQSREQQRARLCARSHMGEQWYEYKNLSRVITNEGWHHPPRVFRACAGQFLIHYRLFPHWFEDVPLPIIHDQLVAFFQAMLPDTPLEVFP